MNKIYLERGHPFLREGGSTGRGPQSRSRPGWPAPSLSCPTHKYNEENKHATDHVQNHLDLVLLSTGTVPNHIFVRILLIFTYNNIFVFLSKTLETSK